MSQTIDPVARRGTGLNRWLRLVGIVLLVILLIRLDFGQIRAALRDADLRLIALAVLCVIPLIGVKTVRWQGILRAQAINMAFGPALLAYFGSLFVGFLTPGRLGEFIKAVHVQRDCDVSLAQAFSTVLADRLFDLYTLLAVGCAALLTLALVGYELLAVLSLVVMLTLPLVLFLQDDAFGWMQCVAMRFGAVGRKLFAEEGILPQIRVGLRSLTWRWTIWSVVLTIVAYGIFFGQCYLLACALDLAVGFVPVMFAVALGSLVTLIPVSISGLGTREAAMIAYLDTAGITAEAALSFSLLVFVTFYIAGGVIGAVAWWIKPVPLRQKSSEVVQDS
jgi:glycosyltransferase 2 family protein